MSFLEVTEGQSPLVLGLPHTGTDLPDAVLGALNDTGKALADTDWHIHDLYSGLVTDVTTVRTRIHRYVIDVNRDPGGASLYPGQNTTTLCPLTDFDGRALYPPGNAPDADEIEERKKQYHAPYHAALEAALDRVKKLHGFAILFDCHSIRSQIPFLFEGTLPDFNIGTDDGRTCDPAIERLVQDHCDMAEGYVTVTNARFKGGWTTRHYGRPTQGVHAIQMELAQSTYLAAENPPWTYDAAKADRLQSHLRAILEKLSNWQEQDFRETA